MVMDYFTLCIEDEPEDGPQHYILVLGFYQPHLIGALDAIGVHIANVIRLCSECTQTSGGKQEQHSLDTGKELSVHNSIYIKIYNGFNMDYIIISCVCQKQRVMVKQNWLRRPGSWIYSGPV